MTFRDTPIDELLMRSRLLGSVQTVLPRDHPLRARIHKMFEQMAEVCSAYGTMKELKRFSDPELDEIEARFDAVMMEFERVLASAKKHVQ